MTNLEDSASGVVADVPGVSPENGPIIGVDHPSTEGEVMLFKEATHVDGTLNTWDVTLRVEGKDAMTKSDVVLVIDISDTMGREPNQDRIVKARAAANDFVDKLLGTDAISQGTSRIAVVSFANNATTVQELTDNVSDLKVAIDGLESKEEGTFTQAGIRQARKILDESQADHKHIVLLSDGLPTFSYDFHNPEDYFQFVDSPDHLDYYETRSDVPESAYNYPEIAGDGTASWKIHSTIEVGGDSDKKEIIRFYSHGNSAIAESSFAKGDGYTVWAVGLELDKQGKPVMDAISSSTNSYEADTASLQGVFKEIAGAINSAVQNSTVVDPMGAGFEIPASHLEQINSVPVMADASYNEETKTISWNVGTLVSPVEGHPGVKYAELNYRVTINDAIFDAQTTDGKYSTNGDAKITYTNVGGTEMVEKFPVPTVDPTFVTIEKVLYDVDGKTELKADRNFTVKATGARGYEKEFVLNTKSDQSSKKYLEMPANSEGEFPTGKYAFPAGTYTFEESGVQSGNPADFYATIKVNGTEAKTLNLQLGDNDSEVVVENRPKVGALGITKKLEGTALGKAKSLTYSGTYECVIPAGEKDLVTASGKWTTKGLTWDGNSVDAKLIPDEGQPAVDEIPLGSKCSVTEDQVILASGDSYEKESLVTYDPTNPEAQSLHIAQEGQVATVTVTNTLNEKPGAVTWNKVAKGGTEGETLGGSEWELWLNGYKILDIVDCTPETEGECDAVADKNPDAGKFRIEGLQWGKYELIETSAPAGYVLDRAPHKFTIDENAKDLQVQLGDIENAKVTSPMLPLTGSLGSGAYILAGGLLVVGGLAVFGAYVNRRRAN
ncbi:MAG: VWA domain-containing protein [Actinomycetaceae bacterium]|nr:VWA domain-containing protein [Actinomycetaceae bacterium]